MMEAVVILLGVLLVILVLPIIILVKVSDIAREVEELKRMIRKPVDGSQSAMHRPVPNAPLKKASVTFVPRLAKPRNVSEINHLDSGELTALDVFWGKVGDWFCVSGAFAPKGMTREFAVATRWLVRVGIILMVAGVVYFVKLSIDYGWMGPTGRIVATLFWGTVSAIAGTWLAKRTRYGMIGHAIVAIGIVALYLGFGLGHRFFDPPVIQSAGLTFVSFVAVTVCAGIMAAFLHSPTIAVMGLVGGYLVPAITCGHESMPLGMDFYLITLNLGAFAVARRHHWLVLDFLAAIFACLMCLVWSGAHLHANSLALLTNLAFLSVVHALYLVSVIVGLKGIGSTGCLIAWSGLAVNAGAFLVWLGVYFRLGFSNEMTGFVFLVLAGVLVAVATYAIRNGLAGKCAAAILFGFGFLVVVIAQILLFGLVWCTAAWAILSLAGIWLGLICRIEVSRIVSLGLLGVSVVKLLVLDTVQLAMPARVAASAIIGALLISGAFLYIRFKERFETSQGKGIA